MFSLLRFALIAAVLVSPDLVQAAETVYRVQFTEPTLDSEGKTLNDLASCTINVWDAVPVSGRNLVNSQVVSASGLAGGTARSLLLTATANALEKGKAVSATCVDVAGNVSAESNIVAFTFRSITPGRITDLSIAAETR